MGFSLELPLTDFSAIACSPRFLNCLYIISQKIPCQTSVRKTYPKQVSSPARGNLYLQKKTLGELLEFRVDVVKHSRLADMQDYHFDVYDIDDGALTYLARLGLKPLADFFLTAIAAPSGFHLWHRRTALLARAKL
jgi:hypothetical protein